MIRRLALSIVLALAGTTASAQIRTIGYDRFMSLSERERQAAFREADPGTKAMLKRVHAERWLERHRAGLSDRQVKAVERGIAFLAPALYEATPEQTLSQEIAMTESLVCALGRANVRAAFTFLPPEKVTLGSRIEDFFYWLHACIVG